MEGSQGRNSGHEPESRNWRGALLTDLLLLACSACFPVDAQRRLPHVSITQGRASPPTSVLSQGNTEGLPTGQSAGRASSVEALFPEDWSLHRVDKSSLIALCNCLY